MYTFIECIKENVSEEKGEIQHYVIQLLSVYVYLYGSTFECQGINSLSCGHWFFKTKTVASRKSDMAVWCQIDPYDDIDLTPRLYTLKVLPVR